MLIQKIIKPVLFLRHFFLGITAASNKLNHISQLISSLVFLLLDSKNKNMELKLNIAS